MIKKKFFLVLELGILVTIIIGFMYYAAKNFVSKPNKISSSKVYLISPTEIVPSSAFNALLNSSIEPSQVFPTTAAVRSSRTNPPVNYVLSDSERLQKKIDNRAKLTSVDLQVKEKLTNSADQEGIVYQGDTFRVDYVSAADLFQVEIQSQDYQNAKKNAVNWFYSQGLSLKGVCDLPVMFYFNYNIANELRGNNIEFSPLADGC